MDDNFSNEDFALLFRNVFFNYGNISKDNANYILTGINISVPKGGIYGLLGSSGCGKTTLLRCALGRLSPQSGTVLFMGKRPGSVDCDVPGPGVGYMPQELALYTEFTIGETLQYFGRIFGMTILEIRNRINFLIELLQLPGKERIVGTLSGGQQRRVSLATALFHSPPLLILDEPTVGVDPLLREAIWMHLETLCKSGLTVILTTHYIEEARSAKVVGFMRSGKLLTEGSPNHLLIKYRSPSLESVFLRLCRAEANILNPNTIEETININNYKTPRFERKQSLHIDETESENNNGIIICKSLKVNHFDSSNHLTVDNSNKNGITNPSFTIEEHITQYSNNCDNLQQLPQSNGFATMTIEETNVVKRKRNFKSRMSALTRKNVRQLSRNWLLLSFFVILPSVEIVLLVISVGQDPKELPIAVLNEEKGISTEVLRNSLMGEKFLNAIDKESLLIKRYDSFNDAINAVKDNHVWAAIVIKKDFTDALRLRRELGPFVDNATLDASNIRLYIDMSNQVIGFQIQRQIFEAFLKFVDKIARDNGINPETMKPPIVVEEPIYGVKKPTLTTFVAPGALIVVAYFATTVVTTHLLIRESHDGLVERSLVAGVKSLEFVMSHVITQILILMTQIALKLFFAFVIFSIPMHGSLFTAVSLTFLQGACGLMFGLMVSAACPDEIYATMLGIGTFFPSVIVGGIFWPLESMPIELRYISYVLPSTLAIESLRCILLRGWGFEHFKVSIGFIVTILWFMFFLIHAIIFFKRKL